jgi:AraC family transcriptional regulator of adaptative response/methylated-DNA-[protein]-cysteine methyltransferase
MNPRLGRRWWTAARRRDPAFHEVFVFGVVTTGIYCRPTCPARRPKARNVQFFPRARDAELEGFRPCRRCRPEVPSPRRPEERFVRRACDYLRAHAPGRVSLGDLSRALRMSPHHLQRTFTRALGISPRRFLDALRFERFRGLSGAGVTAALYGAGFGSSSRLYERALGRLGMTPGTYQNGGAGMTIAFDVLGCPVGKALVAATPLGICAVELGSSSRELVRRLRERHPKAVLRRSRVLVREAAAWLRRNFKGALSDPSLPLDIRATAFQARVWAELRSIPAGSTRSYGQIARSLGRPRAARAVAQACSQNPVAVLIPCHRAVARGGGLAGYRWGIARKKGLLSLERRTLERSALREGSPGEAGP